HRQLVPRARRPGDVHTPTDARLGKRRLRAGAVEVPADSARERRDDAPWEDVTCDRRRSVGPLNKLVERKLGNGEAVAIEGAEQLAKLPLRVRRDPWTISP